MGTRLETFPHQRLQGRANSNCASAITACFTSSTRNSVAFIFITSATAAKSTSAGERVSRKRLSRIDPASAGWLVFRVPPGRAALRSLGQFLPPCAQGKQSADERSRRRRIARFHAGQAALAGLEERAACVCVRRRRCRSSRSRRLRASFVSMYCASASDRFRNSCTVVSFQPAASKRRFFSVLMFSLRRPHRRGAVCVGTRQ